MTDSVFSKAQWICPRAYAGLSPVNVYHKELDKKTVELPEELRHLHILFRKSFVVSQKAGKYGVRITADDYYRLKINGEYVGQGPAQGYPFCYYWNEYDVTEFIHAGENTIEAEVYYQGLINRAYNSGDRRIGLIAEITADGKPIEKTDETWECAVLRAYLPSHTVGYDTCFVENYNSRISPKLTKKAVCKQTDHIFSEKPVHPLQVYSKEPLHKETLTNGALFMDFGTEIVGTLTLTAEGKSGQTVRILCGEETDDSDVRVRYRMRCNCVYDETWTLAQGINRLEQYEYKAFRYVTLVPDSGIIIHNVTARVRHYPFDDDFCQLETDSKELSAVWNICKNGIKYGAQEVYVDCPSREKGQYAGDLTVSSASQILLTGDLSLFTKAIENQRQSSFICPGLMAVTPGSFMQEIADYSLQFPILALRHYGYTGDREALQENLKTCEAILDHFSRFARSDGLLEAVTDKWNLVDWPVGLRDGYDFPLDKPIKTDSGAHNVVNAFYIGAVMQTEQIRSILGIPHKNCSAALISAFEQEFLNRETGLYTDSAKTDHSSLHANVLPLFYGFSRPENAKNARDFIMEKGLCCGVYFAYFVLKALCRIGCYEDAYSLIVNESEHSWLNMVREGATTCFEAWGKDQKQNTSLCHPWASGPIPVLIEDILPHMPEFGRILWKDAETGKKIMQRTIVI